MKLFKVKKGNQKEEIMEEHQIYPLIEKRASTFISMFKNLKVGEGVYSNDTMTNYERIK